MDLTAISDALVSSLAAHLGEGRSDASPPADATAGQARATGRRLLAVFDRNPQAASIIRDLMARPNSLDAQDMFREKSKELLEQDADLLAQVEAALSATGAPLRSIVEIEPEGGGAYPRPMPARRRCEG
jgi:hypothetical protein